MKEWNLPDIESEYYIRSLLSRIEKSLVFDKDVELDPDEVEDAEPTIKERDEWLQEYERFLTDEERELLRDETPESDGDRWQAFRRLFHSFEEKNNHDFWSWEYMGSDPYEGTKDNMYDNEMGQSYFELRGYIDQAHGALDMGDPDEFDSAFDLLDPFINEDIDMNTVSNWRLLLVDRKSPSSSRESIRKDNDTVQFAQEEFLKRICEIVARNPLELRKIDWRDMERIVAHVLKDFGFDVTLTPSSKDGGKDIVADIVLAGRRVRYFIEVKHWRSGKKVGAKDIYDFIEVNATSSTDGGLFLSTSGFNKATYSHLSMKISSQKVRLGTREKVVTLCQHYSRKGHGLWTSPTTLPRILFENTLPEPCH